MIKESIKLAKNGDQEAERKLRRYYSYLIEYYYKKYSDKITRNELNIMYNQFLNEYYNTEQELPLALYLHKHFISVLHEMFDKKEIEVREAISLACQGDMNARNKLIEHFSKMVYEVAKKYDYLEYDELVQFGIIKLIENIDSLIELHPNGVFATAGLPLRINSYFDKTLRDEVTMWNSPDYHLEDQFSRKIEEMEFEDFIETYPCVNRDKQILREYCFENGTLREIGKQKGVSHEFVRMTIKEASKTYQKIR